ncbi:hypothetical protein, partial [Klebsiella pneumoniae]|uniref:hypothetical protein n=1 Tax=Klebsiella pneumoniae TaxID=573 RepID=UPI0025A29D07
MNRNTKDDDTMQTSGYALAGDDSIIYTISIMPATTNGIQHTDVAPDPTQASLMSWKLTAKLTQYIEWSR